MPANFSLQEYMTLKHTLRFKADGTFKILMLTDLHGGNGMHAQLKPGIDAMVVHCRPDLVLLGGDIAGHRIGCATTEELEDYLRAVTESMEANRIPWAHVYGNHDYNKGLSNEEQQAVYETFTYCITKRGPNEIHGVGNYVLPILRSSSDDVALNVWGFDTHDDNSTFAADYGLPEDMRFILPNHFCMGKSNDSVHFDQVMWYFETSKAIERAFGRKIPGLMYMHIPIPEYCLISRNPKECDMVGEMRETICCGELNPGLFSACLQRGDVKAIFCGHDHLNDYSGEYCGIRLSYCAGICYDAGSADDMRGGRVIELSEQVPDRVETYMVKLQSIMGSAANKR